MTEEIIKRIIDKTSKIHNRNFSSEQLDKLEEYIDNGIVNLEKYNNIYFQRNTFIFTVVFLILILFSILFFVVHPILFIEQWTEQDEIRNKIRVETLKIIGLITGGVLAFFGLYLGYIRAVAMENSAVAANKTAEAANKNAEIAYQNTQIALQNVQIAEDKQITERFSKAVEQLASDKIEVRLGGIYTLDRIAKDSPKDHWTIMKVITAFVRKNAPLKEDNKFLDVEKFIDKNLDNQEETKEFKKLQSDIQESITIVAQRNSKNDPKGQKLNLSNINITEADLEEANFAEADLGRVNLAKANLIKSNLAKTNLVDSNLARAFLREANLAESDLVRANLTKAFLADADLTEADLSGADLTKAYLGGANLVKANLTRAYLGGANLTKAFLADADLTEADLTGANLTGANLTGADLTGANLEKVDFTLTILKEANLTSASLAKANLTFTYIAKAILTDADIENADFTNNKTIKPDQITKAKNWEKAKYDKDFCEKLGLPLEDGGK